MIPLSAPFILAVVRVVKGELRGHTPRSMGEVLNQKDGKFNVPDAYTYAALYSPCTRYLSATFIAGSEGLSPFAIYLTRKDRQLAANSCFDGSVIRHETNRAEIREKRIAG